MTIEELEEHRPKLEDNTQKTAGCWYWLKGNRIRLTKTEFRYPAALAWELANKEKLPLNMFIGKTCENKKCVRPDHLELRRTTFPGRA